MSSTCILSYSAEKSTKIDPAHIRKAGNGYFLHRISIWRAAIHNSAWSGGAKRIHRKNGLLIRQERSRGQWRKHLLSQGFT